MTVADALSILQAAGTVCLEGDRIRAWLPRPKMESLRAAIHVVRRGRRTALRLLQQQERAVAGACVVRCAGAGLVPCRDTGHLSDRPFNAIFVPYANDDLQFRAALRKLRLDSLPVLARTDPLDSFHRPTPCSRESTLRRRARTQLPWRQATGCTAM